ncbi:hypothetical protein [Vibrio furnissii]|uniref:hypothetical protein n=1 Tax=Vibrio furnissii TaxID=29494 RepID=UPI001EEC7B5A|nr:hypothetical protein [Vibrio furnissii]MCG6268268.1 hypothetical protein [Vibrio furnissii]
MLDNTQGTLGSVPFAIRDFYHEETRSEPTGNKLTEKYTVLDAEGQETPSERLVDEYADVTYVVMNARQDLKTWQDVERVKALGRYDVTRYNIGKAHERDLWVFHDAYLTWLGRKPALDAEVFMVKSDADSEPSFSQDNYDAALASWQSQEPVNDVTGLVTVLGDYHQELAKRDVITWIESNLPLFDVIWQVNERSRGRMEVQLGRAARNGLDLSSTKIDWILADNSTRETTLAELGQVLDEYAKRQTNIVNQYVTWRDGDRQQRFVYPL